jgi:hypothetical protein
MSRRRRLVAREPNGRAQRSTLADSLPPPTEVYRLRQAARAGLRASEWGTELGRLNLVGALSDNLYATGQRWAVLAQQYHRANDGPKAPASTKLEVGVAGHPPDLNSEPGRKEIARDGQAMIGYLAAREALRDGAPFDALQAVIATCELDEAPIGMSGLELLRRGLETLDRFFRAKRRRR